MLVRLAPLALVVLTLGLSLGAAQAEQPFIPSWIKNDPATRSVTIELAADFTEHLRHAEVPRKTERLDISDFNGYWGGGATVAVPTGWSVRVDFSNRSTWLRHSLMVTKPYPQSEMPVLLTEQDAVWGAYTTPLEGIKPGETVQLSFVAQEPGSYYLACARRRHLVTGHWIGFDVKDGLEQAVVVVHEDKIVPEEHPGRS